MKVFVAIVSCFVVISTPSAAQPQSGKTYDLKEVREKISSVEERQRIQAEQWAASRNIPLLVPQVDGSSLQLVGVDGIRPIYLIPHNVEAAAITKTRLLHPGERLGLRLTGRGLRIGIWDQGNVLVNHQELAHRVLNGDGSNPGRHATGVAGTLAATGILNEAQGMAYEAEILSYDWNRDLTEMLKEAEEGLLFSNHSYGIAAGWVYGDFEQKGAKWYWFGDPAVSVNQDVTFGRYDSKAEQIDLITYTNQYYLPVIAAGNDRDEQGPDSGTYRALDTYGFWETYNIIERPVEQDGGVDGYDSIGGMAVAKNILTVGAIEKNEAGMTMVTPFSSFGPVDDGRIKPDIMGYGAAVLSSFSLDPLLYGTSGGTSVATANVSGSLVLLHEYYRDVVGSSLRAASLKGLVIHTAQDLGPPGPDYQYGWGLLDAEAAIHQISSLTENPLALYEHSLEDGFTHLYVFKSNKNIPLRVTLSWTDPPSTFSELAGPAALNASTPHLIHDLDVRLFDQEGGETSYPFVLDGSHPDALSIPGDNVVDPVEQIVVPRPSSGTYVAAISHKESLKSPFYQSYSLLVSGAESKETKVVAMSTIQADVRADSVRLSWEAQLVRAGGSIHLERAFGNTLESQRQYFPVQSFSPQSTAAESEPYSFEDSNLKPGAYSYRLVYTDSTLVHVFRPKEVIIRPILFDQIQAQYVEDAIVLDWNTTAELNQVQFHVERAMIQCRFVPSTEESTFTLRGVLTSDGPALEIQSYRFIDPIIDSGCYRYRISVEDLHSDASRYILTETEVHVPLPDQFAVLSNYPNPFREKTQIIVDLVYPFRISGGQARVDVYDITGRHVVRLHEGHLPPGRQQFPFSASGLAAGVYFVRFSLEHHWAQQVEGEQILIHPLVVVE